MKTSRADICSRPQIYLSKKEQADADDADDSAYNLLHRDSLAKEERRWP